MDDVTLYEAENPTILRGLFCVLLLIVGSAAFGGALELIFRFPVD